MNHLAVLPTLTLPAPIITAGDRACFRYVEFFTAQIRNPNTPRAYARNVRHFMTWLEQHGVPSIEAVNAVHVAL